MTFLLGMVSSYLEGPLVQGAIRTALEACDHVLVCEGPAGEPIEADVPESDFGRYRTSSAVDVISGRWRTDARKRQAMLEWAQQHYPGPLWGVIVDADETLHNGVFLRDWLQRLDWEEECHPDGGGFVGRPMRLLELDGSVMWVRGRLLRLDRIGEYRVSTSIFTVKGGGTYQGGGNEPDLFSAWAKPREPYVEADRMLVMPPLPTEPFLVHRSMLRHPLRAGNRMHEQERQQLIAAGLKVD